METSPPPFEKYVFVCVNERPLEGRVSCGGHGCGKRLRDLLKAAVRRAGAAERIRVCAAGCLDACEKGPNVLVYPDGAWFFRVTEEDVEVLLAACGLETGERKD